MVELLVVFSILFISTAAGVASFRSFGASRALDSSAANVESFLNQARANAVTQTLPSTGCALNKYSVEIDKDNNLYKMNAYCNNTKTFIKKEIIPRSIAFNINTEIFFSISSGVSPGGTIVLKEEGTGKTKTITIDETGNITVN